MKHPQLQAERINLKLLLTTDPINCKYFINHFTNH